jgi:hypothetical protein
LEIELPSPVITRMDSISSEDWVPSTVARELQYLLSHTIHHHALIGTICASLAVALPKDFGIALSTLKYRHQTQRGP